MPRGKKSRAKAAKSEADDIKGEPLVHLLREKLPEDERTTALNLRNIKDDWRWNLRRTESTKKNDLEELQPTVSNSITEGTPSLDPDEGDSHLFELHGSHLRHVQSLVELQQRHREELQQEWGRIVYTAVKTGKETPEVQPNQEDFLQMQQSYEAEYREKLDSVFELSQTPKVIEGFPQRQELQLKNQNSEKEPTGESRKDVLEKQKLEEKLLDLNMQLISNDCELWALEHQQVALKDEPLSRESHRGRKQLCVLSELSDRAAHRLLYAVNRRQDVVCLSKLCQKQEDELEVLRRRRDEQVSQQRHLQQTEGNTLMVHGHRLQTQTTDYRPTEP